MNREINGYIARAQKLKDFSGLNADTLRQLECHSITDNLQFLELVSTPYDRRFLAEHWDLSVEEVNDLALLSDLSRLRWVGPAFARLLVSAGYNSVQQIAVSKPDQLFAALTTVNRNGPKYNGRFGERDLRLLVRIARDLPPAIEW